MTKQTTTEYRDPSILHVHPELLSVPQLSEDELRPIRAGMQRNGITQPLLIDAQNRILDDHSRTLWLCAKAWAFTEVPVLVRASEDVHLLIIIGLAHRRHLTKSAIAYLAVPHLQPVFDAAHAQMLQKLAKTPAILGVPSETPSVKTADELAEDLGIGRNLLFEARKVRTAFADRKKHSFLVSGGPKDGDIVECTLKDWFEPRILRAPIGGEHEVNRPIGLGAVIAGIAGLESTKDKPREDRPQLELFSRSVIESATAQYKYWSQMGKTERQQAIAAAERKAAMLEGEQCEGLVEMYETLAGIYRKQSKLNEA